MITVASVALILKLIVVAFVLADLASFIGEILLTFVEMTESRYGKIAIYLMSHLLSCSKCFSFWFSLVLGGDLLTAAIVGLSVELLRQYFNSKKTQTTL